MAFLIMFFYQISEKSPWSFSRLAFKDLAGQAAQQIVIIKQSHFKIKSKMFFVG